jgi:hypothetical protein
LPSQSRIETKPQNYRAYLMHHEDALGRRLSGDRDYLAALRHFSEIGMPATWLERVTPHGILASFDGAFTWIEHPAHGNCALIGDAAAIPSGTMAIHAPCATSGSCATAS